MYLTIIPRMHVRYELARIPQKRSLAYQASSIRGRCSKGKGKVFWCESMHKGDSWDAILTHPKSLPFQTPATQAIRLNSLA